MWKNRECGKQILRACEGTGRAEKAGESGKKYGLLQLYMGILLLLVISVSGNVPYSGVNREKISLYGSRAEQGDKKEDPAAVQSAVKPEPLNLNSRSAVLMDADTGRVLYGKNETEDLPMASTTKIMTCILALENAGPETEVLVSDRAASMPEVKLHIKKGEKYRMEDLLYSLMLESHNDSAVAIAEAVAGSVEKFADMMNRKAAELGCGDTCFVTPNGLDAEKQNADGEVIRHGTTAAELAKILRYCTKTSPKHDEFLTITRCRSYSFSDSEGYNTYSCQNHNALLDMTQEAVTGKTGFTGGAGYCYAAELSDGERSFILTLLGCGWPPHKAWKWEDVQKLYSYGKQNYFYCDFTFEENRLRVPLLGGAYKDWIYAVSESPEQKRSFHLLISETERPVAEYDMKTILDAPVKAGDEVGVVRYRLGQEEIGQSHYCSEEDAAAWGLSYCLQRILDFWIF